MKLKIFVTASVIQILFVLWPITSLADLIYLRSGKIVKGEVLGYKFPYYIRLGLKDGEKVIQLSEVAHIIDEEMKKDVFPAVKQKMESLAKESSQESPGSLKQANSEKKVSLDLAGIEVSDTKIQKFKLTSGKIIEGKVIENKMNVIKIETQDGVLKVPYRLIDTGEQNNSEEYNKIKSFFKQLDEYEQKVNESLDEEIDEEGKDVLGQSFVGNQQNAQNYSYEAPLEDSEAGEEGKMDDFEETEEKEETVEGNDQNDSGEEGSLGAEEKGDQPEAEGDEEVSEDQKQPAETAASDFHYPSKGVIVYSDGQTEKKEIYQNEEELKMKTRDKDSYVIYSEEDARSLGLL